MPLLSAHGINNAAPAATTTIVAHMLPHRARVRWSSALLAAALATVALAACSNSEQPSTAESTTAATTTTAAVAVDQVDAASLDGKTFTATTVTGRDLVEGSDLTLTFEDDLISVGAGCNSLFGPYLLEEGSLEVEQMASTMMMCEPELMAQDSWIQEYLAAGPAAALDGDTLTLTSADTTIAFTAAEA